MHSEVNDSQLPIGTEKIFLQNPLEILKLPFQISKNILNLFYQVHMVVVSNKRKTSTSLHGVNVVKGLTPKTTLAHPL